MPVIFVSGRITSHERRAADDARNNALHISDILIARTPCVTLWQSLHSICGLEPPVFDMGMMRPPLVNSAIDDSDAIGHSRERGGDES